MIESTELRGIRSKKDLELLISNAKKYSEKMEKSKFVAFTIAILFGITLIVSGLPLESDTEAPASVEIEDDNSTTNGTHKEL